MKIHIDFTCREKNGGKFCFEYLKEYMKDIKVEIEDEDSCIKCT